MNDQEIINQLYEKYGEEIVKTEFLPKAYNPGGINAVKAIYLGCDPTNTKYDIKFEYAFAHKYKGTEFKQFINSHTEQLTKIGLSWETVYTQNLCRNYFKEESSKNKIWKKVASEFWISELFKELSVFDSKIPVLLTSQLLLEVLGDEETSKYTAPDIYEGKITIPIPADKNKIGRPLIPAYRGKSPRYKVSYHLKNEQWKDYRESIVQYFKEKE
ncbi:MAG: hypothetical protein ACOYLE_04480 [Bacteroidales bacterium]